MKESFLIGLAMGMIGGVMLHKYCKTVREIANKGEKVILSEMEMIEKEAEKAANNIKKAMKKPEQNSNKTAQ